MIIGMAATTQITVRIPNALVAYVDKLVGEGKAPSRAAVVSEALDRERRRALDERDAEIYAATEPDEDMQALAEWNAQRGSPDLDD
jgi:Arc/MetJ-type ribon-helix-helix transcriptional regulator